MPGKPMMPFRSTQGNLLNSDLSRAHRANPGLRKEPAILGSLSRADVRILASHRAEPLGVATQLRKTKEALLFTKQPAPLHRHVALEGFKRFTVVGTFVLFVRNLQRGARRQTESTRSLATAFTFTSLFLTTRESRAQTELDRASGRATGISASNPFGTVIGASRRADF